MFPPQTALGHGMVFTTAVETENLSMQFSSLGKPSWTSAGILVLVLSYNMAWLEILETSKF